MHITLKYDELTSMPYTTGTIQNINERATVEICKENQSDTGLILAPGEKFKWSNSTVYARSAWASGENVEIAVVPFHEGEGGGGGGSSVAVYTEQITIPATGWEPNGAGAEYEVKRTISSTIAAGNRAASLAVSENDMPIAESCGLSSCFDVSSGSITVYAVQEPESDISATLTMIGE